MSGQYLLQNVAAWQVVAKPPSGMSLAGNGTTAGGGSVVCSHGSYMSAPARSPVGIVPPLLRSDGLPAMPMSRSSPPVDDDGVARSADPEDIAGAFVPPHAATAIGSEA